MTVAGTCRRAAALLSAAAFAGGVLLGCSERSQEMDAADRPHPTAWQGTDNGYTEPGWKAGDAQSWDEQMRRRAQGQNEYSRIGGGAG
jgi:hypothetical protein